MTKTVTMNQTKITKGTVVYGLEENGRPVSFYIPKEWLGEGTTYPDKITLTIETPTNGNGKKGK